MPPKKRKKTLKNIRQSEKRRLRNRTGISRIRTIMKTALALVKEKKKEEASKTVREANSVIDKSVKTKLIKKNAGSRYKSILARAFNSI